MNLKLKLPQLTKSDPQVNAYLSYLVERSVIYHRKQQNITPLTDDPILQKYKFTNVWRDLDAFSVEEIKRIRKLPLLEQIKVVSIARYVINWKTYDVLMNATSLDEIYAHWRLCKEHGVEFVGSALNFYPPIGQDRAQAIWNHRNEVLMYAKDLEQSYLTAKNPLYLFSKITHLFTNIGLFRAYEIYTSLTYSEHVQLKEDDVFHVGPGAIDGLSHLIGYKPTEAEMNAILVDLSVQVKQLLLDEPGFHWISKDKQGSVNHKEEFKFTVRTFEDSLCEYRKYLEIKAGKGRRRKYVPKK